MFDVMSLVVCENWWTETECPCRSTLFKQQAVLVSVSHFDVSWVGLWSFYSFNISHIHIIDYDQIRLSDPCPTYTLHITFPFQLYVLLKKKPTESPECFRSSVYGSWNIRESVGGLSGATSLKEADFSHSNHRFPIAPQLGLGLPEPFPLPV